MRLLITLLAAMALALAACEMGATSPSEQPIPTVQGDDAASPGDMSSPSTGDMASPSGMRDDDDDDDDDGASPMAMSCDEAVTEIQGQVSSFADLDEVTDELDDAIAACGSVDELESELTDVVPELSLTDIRGFIDERCDDNDAIDDTPVCEEVD